jgi:hypothetical protein
MTGTIAAVLSARGGAVMPPIVTSGRRASAEAVFMSPDPKTLTGVPAAPFCGLMAASVSGGVGAAPDVAFFAT